MISIELIELIKNFLLAFGVCMMVGSIWIMNIEFWKCLGYSKGINKERLFLVMFFVIIILFIINNTESIHCEDDRPKVIDGTIELHNVRITGLEYVARQLGEIGAYTAAMAAATKFLQSSTMSPLAKITATIVAGGGSLISYKVIQVISGNKPKVIMELDKANSSISLKDKELYSKASNSDSDTVSTVIKSSIEKGEDYYVILEVLQLNLALQLLICYLLVTMLIIFVSKLLIDNSVKFRYDWINKFLRLWSKNNSFWLIIFMIFVIGFVIVNIYSTLFILSVIS